MKRVIGDFIEYVKDIVLPTKKKRRIDNYEAQGSTTTTVAKTDSHTAQKLPTIKVLPDELLKHICSYLGEGLHDMIAPVSKRFKKVYVQRFPSKVTYIKNAAASISLAQMFLKEIERDTKAIGEAYHKLILYSIELGNMTVLQWAIRNVEKYLRNRHTVMKLGQNDEKYLLFQNYSIHRYILKSNVYPDVAALVGNIDMLKYLKSLGCVFTDASMTAAIRGGKLDCVKFLHENGIPLRSTHSKEAVERSNLEIVRYLYERGCHFGSICWEKAAYEGDLDILQFLLERDLPFDENDTVACAAQGGHLHCIKYLHENGCSWDTGASAEALCRGSLDCLKYLLENGCPFEFDDDNYAVALERKYLDCLHYLCDIGVPSDPWEREWCCSITAALGCLDFLQYLRQKGYPCSELCCEAAARNGKLRCLTYLRDNGCPWSPQCIVLAVRFNHVDILRYLHTNGCPFDNLQMHCRNAIKHGSIDCLKYLHEAANCVLDNAHFCTIAARRGNVEMLAYLRENNCDWDESDCCRVAIEGNHLNCLKFLMRNGCKPALNDAHFCTIAARRGNVEMLAYLRENNCPLDKRECCRVVIEEKHFKCLKFLIENGCSNVHAEECFRMAVRLRSVECFQYFKEKGFSWNSKYCTSASVSRWRDLDCLMYLSENGFVLELDKAAFFGIYRRYWGDARREKESFLSKYISVEGRLKAWSVFSKYLEALVKDNAIRPMIDKIIK